MSENRGELAIGKCYSASILLSINHYIDLEMTQLFENDFGKLAGYPSRQVVEFDIFW